MVVEAQQQHALKSKERSLFLSTRTTTISPSSSSFVDDGNSQRIRISNIELKYIARGLNFWFAESSGCRVARWIFNDGPVKYRDCQYRRFRKKNVQGREHLVEANDTIYVPKRMLKNFLSTSLVNITQPFVLLSGQFSFRKGGDLGAELVQAIVDDPRILFWFVQNPAHYTKLDLHQQHTINTVTSRFASLPFGLQQYHYNPNKPPPWPKPEVFFRQAFLKHLELPKKTCDVFYGYLNVRTNVNRTKVPSSNKSLPLDQYYDEIASSSFVISPAGDRPDCYRHYEAIALGAIPVTDLDPHVYDHLLSSSPTLFHTTTWVNLTKDNLMRRLHAQQDESPTAPLIASAGGDVLVVVNRNVVFEEYWLEHMDKRVGRPLRWWDPVAAKSAMLKEFVNYAYTCPPST